MAKRTSRPQHVIDEDVRIIGLLRKRFKTLTNIGVHIGLPRKDAAAFLCNWKRLGIPDVYKVKYPDLFMPHLWRPSQDEQIKHKENP